MGEDKDFKELEDLIGIKFNNIDLLRQSMVHRSYLNEHRDFPLDHNERLEFLGDAVLELVVTEYLYLNFPNPEGELTNWRASLVNSKMLAELSTEAGFEPFLYLSKGEAKDIGKARQYILANAFEALIGAIYLDLGYEEAKVFIDKFIVTKLPEVVEHGLHIDNKSKFQEVAQEKFKTTPSYRVLNEDGQCYAHEFCYEEIAYSTPNADSNFSN